MDHDDDAAFAAFSPIAYEQIVKMRISSAKGEGARKDGCEDAVCERSPDRNREGV
jgi:hypothetical protein